MGIAEWGMDEEIDNDSSTSYLDSSRKKYSSSLLQSVREGSF
jgi:hypothetical protein